MVGFQIPTVVKNTKIDNVKKNSHLFEFARVDNKDDIADCDRRFSDVRRQYHFSKASWRRTKYLTLVKTQHLGVKHQHQQTRIADE